MSIIVFPSIPFVTCSGSSTLTSENLPFPNSPLLFAPYVHTVPSCFNAIVWLYPATIFSLTTFSSFITSTVILVLLSISSISTVMYVLPGFIAVTFPLLSTFATSSFEDVYFISASFCSLYSMLNPNLCVAFI